MRSVILQTAIQYITPLMLIFSLFLLFRGHNEPGGGFTGGLVASAAFALYMIANGSQKARELLKFDPVNLIGAGLAIALGSGLISIFVFDDVFMKGFWTKTEYPVLGKLGTPFLFDIGVYLLVIGISLKILFSLYEEMQS